MADEVEMTNKKEPEAEKPPEAKVEAESKVDTKDAELLAELEKMRKALKEANKEAAARRVRLEELEKAEADRKTAEMSEVEKAQAKLNELEAQKNELEQKLKMAERRELQHKVAKAVDLPDGLAERLRGETEEEMTEDAKTILALLPQKEDTSSPKPPPKTPVINPNNGQKGETRAQQKARLFGQRVNTWDKDFVDAHGGGVEPAGG